MRELESSGPRRMYHQIKSVKLKVSQLSSTGDHLVLLYGLILPNVAQCHVQHKNGFRRENWNSLSLIAEGWFNWYWYFWFSNCPTFHSALPFPEEKKVFDLWPSYIAQSRWSCLHHWEYCWILDNSEKPRGFSDSHEGEGHASLFLDPPLTNCPLILLSLSAIV